MPTIDLPLSRLQEVEGFYEGGKTDLVPPYALAFYKGEGFTLTIYLKKEAVRLYFQGPKANQEAAIWGEVKETPSKKSAKAFRLLYPMGGSDEVGTGSFFGGIAVAAALVKKEDLPFLQELGITDSKEMGDEAILQRVPLLVKRLPYAYSYLTPEKYNEVHDKYNMNAIKAKMHNAVLLSLLKDHPGAHLYIDQFIPEDSYYRYLNNEKEVARGIVFSTKGEKAFPAVAAGSCIARYCFLKRMEKMDALYGVHFPQGAGSEVLDFARTFLATHPEAAKLTCKLNFKTYEQALMNPILP